MVFHLAALSLMHKLIESHLGSGSLFISCFHHVFIFTRRTHLDFATLSFLFGGLEAHIRQLKNNIFNVEKQTLIATILFGAKAAPLLNFILRAVCRDALPFGAELMSSWPTPYDGAPPATAAHAPCVAATPASLPPVSSPPRREGTYSTSREPFPAGIGALEASRDAGFYCLWGIVLPKHRASKISAIWLERRRRAFHKL